MSQVKKLQNGGSPFNQEFIGVEKPKFGPVPELKFSTENTTINSGTNQIGSLTIDGKTYEATPELIQSLSSYLHSYGESASPLAGLTSALQNGANVVYDSIGNTISGMSGKWAGIDDNLNTKRNTGTSNWRKRWQATFNTDAHQFRKAVSLLSGFMPGNSQTSAGTQSLKDISGNNLWYKWDEDEAGNKTWLENASENLQIDQRLKDWTSYLAGTDDDRKNYRLNGYDAARIEAIKNLYARYSPEQWSAELAGIAERAKSNSLKAEDIAFLNNFNIIKPNDPETERIRLEAAENNKLKQRFKDSGLDYDTWNPYITWNDKGYWNITPEGSAWFRDTFGGNGNYWFNDAFALSDLGKTGAYDFLNGYFVIGDRLYNQNEAKDPTSDLSKILNRKGGFRELNASMRHNDANNLIEQLWGSDAGWQAPDSQYYTNWIDPNGNIFYRPVTGKYNWNGKENGQQLIQWVEANPELADEFGFYAPRFRATDAYGNIDVNRIGPEVISGLQELPATNQKNIDFFRHKLYFSDNGDSEFDGRYLIGDGVDENGRSTGAAFWINPNDPNSQWIFESNEMSRYASGLEDSAIKIPKEMSDIFQQNPEFIRKFQNNPEVRRKFARLMAGSVASGFNNAQTQTIKESDWKMLGFTPEQARILSRVANNFNRGSFLKSRSARRAERLVSKPVLHKDGGKIEKAALGDMLGSAGKSSAVATQVKTDKPLRDPGSFANFGKDKMQEHDWLELGAVLADAASLGLAFTPMSVASGLTGMAGSTAGFVADVKRDGFQGSDLSQYGLNLLLDSTAMIPVLGGASKSIKVARSLKKIAPVVNKIMKSAAVYGISNAAVQSWNAIQSGDFNMRDLRVLVNALGGATHVARAGIRKPSISRGNSSYPVINRKAGVQGEPLQLTEAQVSSINSKNIKTKDELASEIASILNKSKANGTPEITKEQVIETYNLDDFVRTWRQFGLFGKQKSAIKGMKETKGKLSYGKDYITKNQRNIRLHEAYRKGLAGETTATQTIPGKPITEYVPQGQWRPQYKEVAEIQGTPQPDVAISGPNGTYMPSNNVPAIVSRRKVVTNEADKALPVILEKRVTGRGPSQQSTHQLPIITPTTSGVIWEKKPDEIQSPKEVIPIQQQSRVTWHPINQPVFRKKGGKIVKGQSGVDTQSEYAGEPNNIDLNPALNWGRALFSMHQSDKQLNNWLNRPRYRMQSPLLNAPRFIDSGQGNAYQNAANRILSYKPITSDAVANDAGLRQRQAEATNLELQGALARSQEYGKYKSGLDQFTNENILRLTDIANQNNQFDWQHNIQDVEMTNANIAEKSKFFDQAAYATQDWYSRQHDLRNDLRGNQQYILDTQTAYSNYLKGVESLDAKYKGDTSSDAYLSELRQLKAVYENAVTTAKMKAQKSHLAYPFYVKKGGKVGKTSKVTYSRDPYPELLIQNSKNSTKLVEKLNDSVIKLILQTKPIHVS